MVKQIVTRIFVQRAVEYLADSLIQSVKNINVKKQTYSNINELRRKKR